eukprot:gb/GECH01010565.1/.p1 GENE.gb/GECH01010565.1/~~gb/GECH01010565.1/.p1  ORF type:complete len:302 (+),score=77.57 gb/GECH01010565.1/:1-906(+)
MFQWNFLASDIDLESIKSAQENVKINKLESKITVIHVSGDNILLDLIKQGNQFKYHFCVCNPPFFSSVNEISDNPKTVCQATANEQVTEGGEEQFVSKLIQESLDLKEQIIWFTSMVGKKSSLKQLKSQLQQLPVPVFVTTEFSQGKTSRWGIAWTFFPVEVDALPGNVSSAISDSHDSSSSLLPTNSYRDTTTKRKMKVFIQDSKPNAIIETAKDTLELYSDLFTLKSIDKSLGSLWGELKCEECTKGSKIEKLSLQVLQHSPSEHVLDIECKSFPGQESSKFPPETFPFIFKVLSKSLG